MIVDVFGTSNSTGQVTALDNNPMFAWPYKTQERLGNNWQLRNNARTGNSNDLILLECLDRIYNNPTGRRPNLIILELIDWGRMSFPSKGGWSTLGTFSGIKRLQQQDNATENVQLMWLNQHFSLDPEIRRNIELTQQWKYLIMLRSVISACEEYDIQYLILPWFPIDPKSNVDFFDNNKFIFNDPYKSVSTELKYLGFEPSKKLDPIRLRPCGHWGKEANDWLAASIYRHLTTPANKYII